MRKIEKLSVKLHFRPETWELFAKWKRFMNLTGKPYRKGEYQNRGNYLPICIFQELRPGEERMICGLRSGMFRNPITGER